MGAQRSSVFRAVSRLIVNLAAFLHKLPSSVQSFFIRYIGLTKLGTWPPSPSLIRRIAPLTVLILFLPKFFVDVRLLLSSFQPDPTKIAKDRRTFITAFRKACVVICRANQNLSLCIDQAYVVNTSFAPDKHPEVWMMLDIHQCTHSCECFFAALARLRNVNSPSFLDDDQNKFDLLIHHKDKKQRPFNQQKVKKREKKLVDAVNANKKNSITADIATTLNVNEMDNSELVSGVINSQCDSSDESATNQFNECEVNFRQPKSRQRAIVQRHGSILALLGSIRAAYNDVSSALLDLDRLMKVHKISIAEEKMHQATNAMYILLGHAAILCHTIFKEVVFLTCEGALNKYRDGQELRMLWNETINVFLWELRWALPPDIMLRVSGISPTSAHQYDANPNPLKMYANKDAQLMLCSSLALLESMLLEQHGLLRRLKMGDYRKVLRFTKMILGRPRNWLLTLLSWVLTFLTSVVASSSFHYRNLLISVVKESQLASRPSLGNQNILKESTWSLNLWSLLRRAGLTIRAFFLDNNTAAGTSTSHVQSVGLGLGKSLAEVLFAVFFMEILQVLLEDLTNKCKIMGVAAIEDRLKRRLVWVVLSQDLEDINKSGNVQHERRNHNFTAHELVRDICEEENGIVGGLLDIPLHIISATSTAITTGFLLWQKNSTLLVILLAVSTAAFRLSSNVNLMRDWLGKRLGINAQDKMFSLAEMDLLDGVENFKDMRVNGNEHYHYDQYESSMQYTQHNRDRTDTLMSLFFPLRNLVKQLPMIVSYWVGGWLVLQDALEAGDLANFLETTRQLTRDLRSTYNAVMNLVRLDGQNLRRATSIVDLFDQQPSIGIDGGDRIDSFENGSIEFKNVSFMRPDWPLHQKDISFKVESGSFVALCGRNGAGKSTLFSLLLRLYDADSGEIYVSGRNVKSLNPVDLRSCIAMAVQSPGMKIDSVRANCIYGSERMFEEADDPMMMDVRIHNALEKLHAWNMFSDPKTFPEGIDSFKHDLSGGQKRIIGLVRAIIRDSKILLLDEPTNDLDPDRQEAVKENIFRRRGDQTVLCVTHDISLIREADNIIFLSKESESGVTTIAEQGTYDELKESGGIFQQWHNFKTRNKSEEIE